MRDKELAEFRVGGTRAKRREEKRRERKGGKYEKFALEFLGHILGQDELMRRARYSGEGSRSRS
jgi:hypothetical protein